MNWFQSIIFGVLLGISEFLPISAAAHKTILLRLFGVEGADPIRDLLVHIAVFAGLLTSARNLLETSRRERKMAMRGTRIYNKVYRGNFDYRLVKTAAVPMLLGYLVLSYILPGAPSMPIMALMLALNGIMLYLPCRTLQGNKNARSMSGFDSVLIGLCGALSAVSGISRFGMNTAVATLRGADRQHAANWALLLSVPFLVLMIIMDLFALFTNLQSITFTASFLGYLLVSVFAYVGAYLAVMLVRFLGVKAGYSAFSYYCWGAALFTFILYLI